VGDLHGHTCTQIISNPVPERVLWEVYQLEDRLTKPAPGSTPDNNAFSRNECWILSLQHIHVATSKWKLLLQETEISTCLTTMYTRRRVRTLGDHRIFFSPTIAYLALISNRSCTLRRSNTDLFPTNIVDEDSTCHSVCFLGALLISGSTCKSFASVLYNFDRVISKFLPASKTVHVEIDSIVNMPYYTAHPMLYLETQGPIRFTNIIHFS
jgi:hypothetical protein